jgi:hypothetical protein
MLSAAARRRESTPQRRPHRQKPASPIGFSQEFVGVFERVFGADNRSLPTLRRFQSRGSPETSQPKILCIWVKVDYAAESKSPYENYFDPSSFRNTRSFFRAIRAFLSGSVDDLAFQDVSLHRQVSIIYTPNGPLIYRWEQNSGERREAAGPLA